MGLKRVLVFGGGVAGLSAAHELTEGHRARHFEVEVIERDTVFGGKARSDTVCGDPPDAHGYPGEHGFRFFPTFYRHVIDTMGRIPSGFPTLGRITVADHLRPTPSRMIARYDKAPIVMPTSPPIDNPFLVVFFFLQLLGADTGLNMWDARDFALKLLQIATSSKSRRLAQYECQSWWDFVDAAAHSAAYQRYFADGLTRTLVAAKPEEVNAMTGGDVLVRILIDSSNFGYAASTDRILDGPTEDVWINPWVQELRHRQVTFTQGELISLGLATNGTEISGANVKLADGSDVTMHADYYVMAVPVEAAAAVLDASTGVPAAGERLDGITGPLRDDVRSMTGMQFYLDRGLTNLPADLGHALYVDSEWALTSIEQSNFWRTPFDDTSRWGPGNIQTVWSIDVSDWNRGYASGGGTDANHCSRQQLRDYTLAQLAASLNGDGIQRFDPASVVAWNLDSAMIPAGEVPYPGGGTNPTALNSKKLLVNKPARWQYRPDAAPLGLRNLLLASDYVRTNTDIATMEAANEAARRAVNAILDYEQISPPRCCIYELYYPEILAQQNVIPLQWALVDDERFKLGLPWELPFELQLALKVPI
jgi:Flavin containing amine oxidoreductase